MNLRKLLPLLALLIIGVFLYGQPLKQSENKGILKAGIAKADITPAIPVKLYGYASRKTYSEGIHDPLTARALAFENNGKRIVLVSTDIGS